MLGSFRTLSFGWLLKPGFYISFNYPTECHLGPVIRQKAIKVGTYPVQFISNCQLPSGFSSVWLLYTALRLLSTFCWEFIAVICGRVGWNRSSSIISRSRTFSIAFQKILSVFHLYFKVIFSRRIGLNYSPPLLEIRTAVDSCFHGLLFCFNDSDGRRILLTLKSVWLSLARRHASSSLGEAVTLF